MIVASSCQHTLLVPERLFPSKCRIPAILLPIPQGQADTARQLQRGAGRGRACPWHGVGTAGIPGRGLPRIPGAARPRHGGAASRPSGHAGGQLRGPRERAPNEQQSAAGPRRLRFPERGAPARAAASARSQRRTKRGPCSAPARLPGASERGRRRTY